MIETLEKPLPLPQTSGCVVVGGTKGLTKDKIHHRRRNGMPLAAANLCLVPIDTIYEPIGLPTYFSLFPLLRQCKRPPLEGYVL
jgi:hypothetical protein